MPRKPKPKAPGTAPDTEAMIRVDHAGEYGAVRIYEGQLAVLRGRASADTIRHMAEQVEVVEIEARHDSFVEYEGWMQQSRIFQAVLRR